MGQIIIETTNRINKHFYLTNKKLLTAILKALETDSEPVINPAKLTRQDKADIRDARKALASGDFVTLEEAKEMFNIRV